MFKLIKWAIVAIVVLLGFSFYNKASALSCMATTVQQDVASASAIFVGKVINVDDEKATFEVSKYWKGNLSQNQVVYNTKYWTGYPGGALFFLPGKTYVVYANMQNDGKLRASIDCGRTREISTNGEQEIVNILGNGNTFPFTIPNPILPVVYPYCEYVNNINTNMWRGNFYNNRNQVVSLQKFFQNYYGISINAGGNYGLLTKYYVSKFQREMGINPTGGVGPITISKLKNLCGQIVGGDRDVNGCIGSAGYTWCAVKNKCIRPFEESCGKADETNGGANCKVWYDGCNTCSRQTPGGPMMCTMMACIQGFPDGQMPKPYCKEYFTNTNEKPVIKSFTGPVQLEINQTGTWKVDASIFNNQSLTYNITWGDEAYEAAKMSSAPTIMNSVVVQNTSFEHTYRKAGKYTITIEVKAQNGQSTKTTSTVNVVDTISVSDSPSCKSFYDGCNTCTRSYAGGPLACTKMYCIWNAPSKCNEYFSSDVKCYDNGVGYTEGQSRNCLTVNGMQQCIADASYICRSGSWKVEGGYWYR